MLINVPLEFVTDNPYQRRQDYGDVAALAADIKARGLLQTPLGRLVFDHGEALPVTSLSRPARDAMQNGDFPAGLRVQLAFGHRRLRAHRHLAELSRHEFQEMPVHIDDLDDDAMLDAVWSENQHRSDINPIEQAELLAEKLARAQRFLAALPEWASRETGLPYSGEATHFDFHSDEWDAIEADWKAGLNGNPAAHNTLVVTVRGGYFPFRPYTNSYVSSDDVIDDWKAAIVIGRRTRTAAESAARPATNNGPAPLRPSADELKRWKTLAAKGDRERVKRTQQALLREISPLAENEPAMRALMAMLDASWLKGADEAHRTPSAYEFADHLLEQAWKRAVTWHYSSTNRDTMRQILHRAAISPDVVDPPDPALRLLDIGQEALLDYEEKRNHVDTDALYKRLASVRAAITEFDAVPHVVAGHDELEQLAAYLRAAIEREEGLLSADSAA